MAFKMKSEKELVAMTIDELVAENQAAGLEVDALRDYRRMIVSVRSDKQSADEIRAKHGDDLTDEQVTAINEIVKAPRLSLKSEVNNG